MAPAAAESVTIHAIDLQMLPLTKLQPSPLNPRRHFDQAKLEELAATMGNGRGILEPLLARIKGSQFEVIAGARRLRAAAIAKLAEVPVIVKDLTDAEVLETMVVENDAREDMTPLERAEGYRSLLKLGTLDVDKLAARIGRSRSWVYDVMKLNELIPEAKALLEHGRITAGHAIPLARLTAEQQARAIEPEKGGLFTRQSYMWDPVDEEATRDEDEDPLDEMKVVSVREFNAWIDETFRFPSNPDPELFPDTTATLDAAIEAEEKVISITYKHQVQPEVKDDVTGRIYGPMSWKRADRLGQTCESAVTGVIVIGPHRGNAFKVCVDKNCTVHWAKEKRERERQKKAREAGGASAATSAESSQERWKRENEERQRKQQAFAKAEPAIIAACAARVKTLPISKVVTAVLETENREELARAVEQLGKGKSPEHALRLLLLLPLMNDYGPWNINSFAKDAKAILGVDVKAVIKKATAATAEAVQTTGSTKTPVKAKKKR